MEINLSPQKLALVEVVVELQQAHSLETLVAMALFTEVAVVAVPLVLTNSTLVLVETVLVDIFKSLFTIN
jgi:hypothetical protein